MCEQRAAAWGVTTSPFSDPVSHQEEANPKPGTLMAPNHLVLGIVASYIVSSRQAGIGLLVGGKEMCNIYIFNSINTAGGVLWIEKARLHPVAG